jgi:hypothetical protein
MEVPLISVEQELMSQGKDEVRMDSLFRLLESKPELVEPLLKFAESIGRISEARGTLDDMEGGLLESERTLMGELLPALVKERAHEAVEEALSMAGTKRYRKKTS